jgi:6-phosphogluconolactonase
MARQILGFADADALARFAAEEFVRRARAAIWERGVFRVALAGGSTPRRMHELLAAPPFVREVEWTSVQIFFGDERAVEPDHKDSNFNAACVALLNSVPLHSSQIHRMAGERGDLDAAARSYESQLSKSFAVRPGDGFPQFDLIILGMGKDGHTASLFPHTSALRARDRWVVRNEVPQLGTDRLTLTYPVLNAAACVMFLVSGHDKAEPLERVLEGPRNPDEFPAQGVVPGGGELLWLVDEAAAASLSRRPPGPELPKETRS